ncbi:hypothetical protein GCM10029978_119490 [Actinoallomurus acanthiterrae]
MECINEILEANETSISIDESDFIEMEAANRNDYLRNQQLRESLGKSL